MADIKTEDILTVQDVEDNKESNSSTEGQTPGVSENNENSRGILEVRNSPRSPHHADTADRDTSTPQQL